jgi:hypothetical protein
MQYVIFQERTVKKWDVFADETKRIGLSITGMGNNMPSQRTATK